MAQGKAGAGATAAGKLQVCELQLVKIMMFYEVPAGLRKGTTQRNAGPRVTAECKLPVCVCQLVEMHGCLIGCLRGCGRLLPR